jgi:hypothetical protein
MAVVTVAICLVAGLLITPASAATGGGLLDDSSLLGEDDENICEDAVSVGDYGEEASVAGQDVTDEASTGVADQVGDIGGPGAPDALAGDALPTGDAPVPSAGDGVNVTDATGIEVCALTQVDSSQLPT